jgi:hypothetical protein
MTKLADIAFMALVVLVLIGGLMEAREKQKLRLTHRSA